MKARSTRSWHVSGRWAEFDRIEVWQMVALDRGLDPDLISETPELAMLKIEDWNVRTDAYVPVKAQYVLALDECCEAIRVGELSGETRAGDFRRTLVDFDSYRRWARAGAFDRGLRWILGNRWTPKLDILVAGSELLDGYDVADVRTWVTRAQMTEQLKSRGFRASERVFAAVYTLIRPTDKPAGRHPKVRVKG